MRMNDSLFNQGRILRAGPFTLFLIYDFFFCFQIVIIDTYIPFSFVLFHIITFDGLFVLVSNLDWRGWPGCFSTVLPLSLCAQKFCNIIKTLLTVIILYYF